MSMHGMSVGLRRFSIELLNEINFVAGRGTRAARRICCLQFMT